jgi:hypothetical protein
MLIQIRRLELRFRNPDAVPGPDPYGFVKDAKRFNNKK